MKKKKFKRYDHTDGFAPRPKGPVGQFLEIWLENIWSMIPINVLYSFLRILVIPGGLAQVGMACVTSDQIRQRPSFGITDFFETVKKCWKKALPAGVIIVLIWIFLIFVGWFYYTSSGILATMGLGCCLVAMLYISLADHYLWIQIMIFKLPLKKIFKNACLFVFVNLKQNLLLGAVQILAIAAAVAIFILLPHSITLALLFLVSTCFFPGFYNLLVQQIVFPCVREYLIDPYYQEHPEEDLELRKRMGLM